ncbi:MAG: glycoside hydrolase, partial [Bacteroidota bacterium]|nr:glycoside hydrolase [Bacteroidota bacterium]
MKKHLLLGLSAFGIAGSVLAQNTIPSVNLQKVAPAGAKLTLPYKKNQSAGTNQDLFESYVYGLAATNTAPVNKAFTTATIGTTEYQNQTNSSVCNRIIKSSDGTISATWTMAQLADWSDRGTGYNYFNGTSWGAAPTVRIENIRTGFTNIGVTASGAEVVVAHEATNIHVASRSAKGTGTWSNTALGFPDVWSRLSVGGSNGITLHVISQTTGVGNPPFMGQDGAIAYSRSLDGGATWDKVRTVIPQIDSSFYLGFGGYAYSIDAKG